MNGSELYTVPKKIMVTKLRKYLGVKKARIIEKRERRKEKIVDIFNSKDALTVANFFSYLRIIFAIFIILSLSSYNTVLLLTIFTFGLLTDWLDGIFAEVYEQDTELGKILDPTADKMLIIGVLWPFRGEIDWIGYGTYYLLNPLFLLFYIEIILMISAFIKPALIRNYNIPFKTGANIFGKYKMVSESILVYSILLLGTNSLMIYSLLLLSIFLAILSLTGHWSIRIKKPT